MTGPLRERASRVRMIGRVLLASLFLAVVACCRAVAAAAVNVVAVTAVAVALGFVVLVVRLGEFRHWLRARRRSA